MKRLSYVCLIFGMSLLAASTVQAEVTPVDGHGGSDTPADESVYRFSFRADLNDFDSAEGDVFYIATARSPAPNNLIRVWICNRTDVSCLSQLRVIARRDSGSNDNRWHQIGGAGFGGDSTWVFEWTQSPTFILLRGELLTIDNDERTVDNFRIGNTNSINVSGAIDTTTTGTYYLD